MSAEVGVHWRPLVSCNSPSPATSPSGTSVSAAASLPPLPDLIPIKKSQKCYDRLFKTEPECHEISMNGNVAKKITQSTKKPIISIKKSNSLVTKSQTATTDCYEFVDELEFDDLNDRIATSTTNTSSSSTSSLTNTRNYNTTVRNTCNNNSGNGKKRKVYKQFLPLHTNTSTINTNTSKKCSNVVNVKQEKGELSENSLNVDVSDVKKETNGRSLRTNTIAIRKSYASADKTHPINYDVTDVFNFTEDEDDFDDFNDLKSRDIKFRTDNRKSSSNNITNGNSNDDVYNESEVHHSTDEIHSKAINALNKHVNNINNNTNRRKCLQQKHRKTGRRKQTKIINTKRQSKATSIKKSQQKQFRNYHTNKLKNNNSSISNCQNNNNSNSSVPRVNPIFLWAKQDDTTIVEVRCEDYDKRNRIRITKTSSGWKAIPRTEKSFLLPHFNLELFGRSDEGSTSNVVDTEEETRRKMKKKHKRKKKKHKKERQDSLSNRDTDATTEPELKVPPLIVNIKQEKNICKKDKKVIKVEALESREPDIQYHNNSCSSSISSSNNNNNNIKSAITYDETRSLNEEFDNIEAHIPSHTISLAAINKDRYVHAHVSHNNNNNNNDFITELGFNHQESQENICIEKPIPNDISSAYHRISCGGNNNNGENITTSNNNSNMLVASPTPILIPSPPLPPPPQPLSTESLVSNIAIQQQHDHQLPPPASLLSTQISKTLENARVRNVVAATTQTMPCMENSISTNTIRIEMHSSSGGVGENRKLHSQSSLVQLSNNNNSICETRLLDESGVAACNNINIQQQQGAIREDASTTSSISNMCPDSAPPTAVYETLKREVSDCVENTEDLLSENNKENVLNFSENKHLSDYPDCSELINEICEIQSSATHDLMSQHCDNTMTGTELLDSLIEQRCEDNHISGEDDVKNSMYTLSNNYNEDDDLLLNQAPVTDILSRLNETLTSTPKCLSFNEAGEIEGLHGDLFDTAHNPLNTMEDNIPNPFSQNTGLDDLSLTLKNLTNNNDSDYSDSRKGSESSKDCNNSNHSITIISADSGEEENPKDLTCRKQENEAKASTNNQKKSISHSPRPVSHSSDTIQSPQPSGLPAVPPSPELFTSNNNKNQTNINSSKLFIESILASPKRTNSEAQQKEPLNLGKCRKSASPTVSCSEEIKKSHAMESVVISDDEPSKKRLKKESKDKEVIDVDKLPNPETARLLELLTSGNDPDPLTQFRLLISNPAWKVPDPLLVPKDRLNAVLASPAREIPLLLTTRPELRLPEAFAFPTILQDPDILVISLAQLERILHNQDELLKAKAKMNEKDAEISNKTAVETPKESPVPKSDTPIETPENNTNDMTAAMTMFNQMLWLPYLQQMGQFNPEMFKAMMGLQSPSVPDMLAFMSQNRFNDFSMPNPMDYKRQIEAAMWQEAMANNANLQRAMKIKADSHKKVTENKSVAASKTQDARTLAAAQAQSKLNQMMNPLNPLAGMSPFMQPSLSNQRYFQHQQQAAQLRNQLSSQQAASQLQAAYNASAYNKQTAGSYHNRSQQSSATQKKSTNNLLAQNPFLQVPSNFQEFHEQQQQIARRLQKEKEHQLKQQQMQQEQKPRVTCKSLSNLMQPPRNTQSEMGMFGSGHGSSSGHHNNMSKMSNLMAMPGIDIHHASSSSSSSSHSTGSHSQSHHQQQQQMQHQAKLKVKPGLSLMDPAALQRRLLSAGGSEDDVSPNTVNLDDTPDITSPLWHPLFGK